MPTFETPQPIRAVLNLVFGQARIVAGDRADTIVEMYPRDPCDPADVTTAEQARIDFTDGRLLVSVPEPSGNLSTGGAIIAVIALPTGSRLDGGAVAADFLCEGTVGECRLTTGLGQIRLDRTGGLRLTAALGDIRVEHAAGGVEVNADRGDVHIRQIDGRATIRTTSEGDITVGEVAGVTRVHTDKGDIRIGWAHAGVEARTTQGDIHIAEVVRGSMSADITFGRVEIGIAEGTTARLDLDSTAGTVYKSLSLLESSESDEEIVQVHARTVIGDIVIHRSSLGTD